MARKHRRAAAALARAAKASKDTSCQPISNANVNPELPLPVTDSDSDIECTSWTGGVIHVFSDSEDEHWADSDSTSENDSGFDDLEELEGEELIRSLQIKCQHKLDLKQRAKPTPLVTLEQSVARLGRLVMTRWLITQGRSLQQQGDDVHLSNLLKAGTIHKAKDITLGREEEEND